jgi:hypothetical protein
MIRLVLTLVFAVAACSTGTVPLPRTQTDVRPTAPRVDLWGRWTITSVNGRRANGLWLELGSEGLATVTTKNSAIYVASPQPPTRAFLGCNNWYPSGWTRIGDELSLGIEMSHRTERGCDAATTAVDDEAYAILHTSMAMEFTSANCLRLVNKHGNLQLSREVSSC